MSFFVYSSLSLLSRTASEQVGCQFVVSLQSRVAYRFIVDFGFVISVAQIIRFNLFVCLVFLFHHKKSAV